MLLQCYCGADNCRGWLGGDPDRDAKEVEEEESESETESESSEEDQEEEEPKVQQLQKPLQKQVEDEKIEVHDPPEPILEEPTDIGMVSH